MKLAAANLDLLAATAHALGPLNERVVYLGGATTALLITDPGSADVRATKDVDVIVETATLGEYHGFSEQLRARGFKEDKDGPICRWIAGTLVLDVMPTVEGILGFGNEWYRPAMKASVPYTLPSGGTLHHVTAPYFLATKLAAFDGRGEGDYFGSQDIEDLVTVVNGRPEIADEVAASEPALRGYIAARLQHHMTADPNRWDQCVQGHMGADGESPPRIEMLRARFQVLGGA